MDLSKKGVMLNLLNSNQPQQGKEEDPWKDWDWISLEEERIFNSNNEKEDEGLDFNNANSEVDSDSDSDSDSEEFTNASSDLEDDKPYIDHNKVLKKQVSVPILNLKDSKLYESADSEDSDSIISDSENPEESIVISRDTIDIDEEAARPIREKYSELIRVALDDNFNYLEEL